MLFTPLSSVYPVSQHHWYALLLCNIADPAGLSIPQYFQTVGQHVANQIKHQKSCTLWQLRSIGFRLRHTCGSACPRRTRRVASCVVLDDGSDKQIYRYAQNLEPMLLAQVSFTLSPPSIVIFLFCTVLLVDMQTLLRAACNTWTRSSKVLIKHLISTLSYTRTHLRRSVSH